MGLPSRCRWHLRTVASASVSRLFPLVSGWMESQTLSSGCTAKPRQPRLATLYPPSQGSHETTDPFSTNTTQNTKTHPWFWMHVECGIFHTIEYLGGFYSSVSRQRSHPFEGGCCERSTVVCLRPLALNLRCKRCLRFGGLEKGRIRTDAFIFRVPTPSQA